MLTITVVFVSTVCVMSLVVMLCEYLHGLKNSIVELENRVDQLENN